MILEQPFKQVPFLKMDIKVKSILLETEAGMKCWTQMLHTEEEN